MSAVTSPLAIYSLCLESQEGNNKDSVLSERRAARLSSDGDRALKADAHAADFHRGFPVVHSFANKGHQGHNSHHMWRVPRNPLCLLRLRRSLSPLITASRVHTRAPAPKSILSVLKRSTGKVLEAFEPCEHRGMDLAAVGGGGTNRYTGDPEIQSKGGGV